MGQKQSKRSVDITTTPKKGEGDAVVEGEGRLEKINDVDQIKATTNGDALHNDAEVTVSRLKILSRFGIIVLFLFLNKLWKFVWSDCKHARGVNT